MRLVLNGQWCGFSHFQTAFKKMATLTGLRSGQGVMMRLVGQCCGFGHSPTMFPLDGFWCGFGCFPPICCVCLKMAEISAVFQKCFCLNYLSTISAVFQQFQPLFFRGFRKTAKISAIFLQHALIV